MTRQLFTTQKFSKINYLFIFLISICLASFSGNVISEEIPTYGTAPDGTSCVNYFPHYCPPGSTYSEDTTSPPIKRPGDVSSEDEMPVYGTAPDGSACVNYLSERCPPGSSYSDDSAETGKDSSSGQYPATDEMPVYGTAPDGSACVDYLAERCPPGSSYATPETGNESGNQTGSDPDNGGLPVYGIAPDGSACVNTFPFFCPPGSTYPEGGKNNPSTGTENNDGVATAEDIAKVALEYGTSMLTGDTKLACEAILCLAAAMTPPECRPSLTKYFSIVLKTITRTLRARKAFLALCPISNDDGMPKLIDDISNGAGRCTLDALNSPNGSGDSSNISDVMPSSCSAYYENSLIQQEKPIYVGTPEKGGYWVSPENYYTEREKYERELEAREKYEREKLGDR